MARPETLIARNREGVQRLDPKGLRLLEDRPRTGLRLLDQDLPERRRPGILPLVGRGEEATRLGHECHDLGVVRHRGLGVRGERLALRRHGVRRPGPGWQSPLTRWPSPRLRGPVTGHRRQHRHAQGAATAHPQRCCVMRSASPERPDRRAARPRNRGARAPHVRSIGRRQQTVNLVHSLLTSPSWSPTPTHRAFGRHQSDSVRRSGAPGSGISFGWTEPWPTRGSANEVPRRPCVACVLK